MSTIPMRVAAIDCGTNAIRLLIADLVTDGDRPRLIDVHREERLVRLGEGVDASRMLATQALDRAWRALADYRAVISACGVLDVRMAATSAVRDARNADDFFAVVRSTLGRDAEVLTGLQEAQIGFAGTSAELDPLHGSVLVVDIGGGSTELVVGRPGGSRPGVINGSVSLDVGAVRITERLLRGDPPTAGQIAEATAWVRGLATGAVGQLVLGQVKRLVAVGGTALTTAAAALKHYDLDPVALHLATVPVSGINRAATFLLAANRAHRGALRYIPAGRVDVIGGGALILRVVADLVAERTGIDSVTISRHDILDGLALSMAERLG